MGFCLFYFIVAAFFLIVIFIKIVLYNKAVNIKIESEELKEYIKSTSGSIKQAVEEVDGFKIKQPVFDLAVINLKEGSGGFKIYVAEAGGKLKSEEINHIQFEVNPVNQLSTDKQFIKPINKKPLR